MEKMQLCTLARAVVTGKTTNKVNVLGKNEIRVDTYLSERPDGEAARFMANDLPGDCVLQRSEVGDGCYAAWYMTKCHQAFVACTHTTRGGLGHPQENMVLCGGGFWWFISLSGRRD